jgi:SOS response regulatory protein OraA/RecX
MPLSKPSSSKAVLESTAIRFLSFRPRFKAEVINRLAQKAIEIGLTDPLTLIDQIVESLEKSGFLDDEKLLESYIRSRLLSKKKGPLWIKQHLLHFDLSRPVIEAALVKYADKQTQLSVLHEYLQKQPGSSDLKTKARLFRRLMSRGFAASIITAAFDETASEDV